MSGNTFVVSDASGDIYGSADGYFHDDTRLLSFLRLTVGGEPTSLLSAAVSEDNVFFTSHSTNRPLAPIGGAGGPPGAVHLERRRFLSSSRLYERCRFTNYGTDSVELSIALSFNADFKDIFEIRGHNRAQRGVQFEPIATEDRVEFRYIGLDNITRVSVIQFSDVPIAFGPTDAQFSLYVKPGASADLYVEIGPQESDKPSKQRFEAAAERARSPMREKLQRGAQISTSDVLFNAWLMKSRADLALLTTELLTGPYPYAGIPWFSTMFGRDAIISAWQALWLDPYLARGVILFLATTQAQQTSDFRDAAPGKVIHEVRRGEMAKLGEVPFAQYYGGVDTTCLFVALTAAYADRTGDLDFIEEVWRALISAVGWMDSFLETEPDGLISYRNVGGSGLTNQGWKDSHDSIFHSDGRFPEGPISLVEVQGYAFAAYNGMSQLAARRGDTAASLRWRSRAEQLRVAVEKRFWMEDQQFYGIAIDGQGDLCRVRASNAGHLLFVGLPSAERGRAVARQLMEDAFFTGWGLRTLASGQARFDPVSYHNGSVWPHDTALCVKGLRRYGAGNAAVKILSTLFHAAAYFDMRLPELFCGFARENVDAPVAYPVACVPQAWAAASVFGMLQACLGLTIDGWAREIKVVTPRLPAGVVDVDLRDVSVGGMKTSLRFRDVDGYVTVLRRPDERLDVPIILQT
jgi:glycogen debranching enzyme